jgi:hypothetical protein
MQLVHLHFIVAVALLFTYVCVVYEAISKRDVSLKHGEKVLMQFYSEGMRGALTTEKRYLGFGSLCAYVRRVVYLDVDGDSECVALLLASRYTT